MRVLPLIALALLVSFSASSFAVLDNHKVLGNYKELVLVVEGVRENSVGVTEKDLERTLKLRLMKNGIKPIPDFRNKHYLYLNVNILDIRGGYAANVRIELKKYSKEYVSPDHGASDSHIPRNFVSGYSGGLVTGPTKSFLLENVEEYIGQFILKYLEANME